MAAFYARDLAHVHHHGFAEHALGAAPGLLAALRRAGIRHGHVVDLGCGGGHWLRQLDQAGYETSGSDVSSAAIALARRTAPHARLRIGAVQDVPLPACDAVTALGEVLSYVSAGGGRAPSLARAFTRVAAALRPGGLFVFDLLVAGRPPMHYRTWRAGDDWLVLVDAREQPGRRRLRRDITVLRRVGRLHRRSVERHELRVYERAAVERMLRRAGFTVRVSRRYGRYTLPLRRLAFTARRR